MPPTAKCSVTSAIQRPPRFVRPGDGKRWLGATEKRTDRMSARKLTYSEPSKTTMIGNEEEAARSNDDFFRLAMARVSLLGERSVTFNGNPPSTPHPKEREKRQGGLFETS